MPHTFRAIEKAPSDEKSTSRHEEHKGRLIPFTQSPFERIGSTGSGDQENENLLEYPDVRVKVADEVPWSDLLLELAMTTAFASLTDGTPILTGTDLASYLSFFVLVWSVWASQVAYNMRFRQADWLHRIFVFLQLLVFSSLAAFTNNFDITSGFGSSNQPAVDQLELKFGYDQSVIDAAHFRNGRFPNLNARGISITMAFSRLLLLVQYLTTLHHSKGLRCKSLHAHIIPLVFSTLCYFTAYLVLGQNPGEAAQIAKLVLWYLPVVVEVTSHFVANALPGRVSYSPEAVYSRSATLFIIILGGGLDKITEGFQFIVGNVALGWPGYILILSTAVIFISQFALYLSTNKDAKLGNHRVLAWFFAQFFFLSALIVTLQAIAALLTYANIGMAIQNQVLILDELGTSLMNNPGVNLTATDYPSIARTYDKMGVSLQTIFDYVNIGIQIDAQAGNTSNAQSRLLQEVADMFYVILSEFNALPDPSSALYWQLLSFIDADPLDDSFNLTATFTNFGNIFNEIVKAHAMPALWFFAAAGSTLITLTLITLITRWPRDRWEWGITFIRLVVGIVIVLFSSLDAGASKTVSTPDMDFKPNFSQSNIWSVVDDSWILPPYALALMVEQIIELGLVLLADRSHRLAARIKSRDSVPSLSYEYCNSSDDPSDDLGVLKTPYDPYSRFVGDNKRSSDFV